MCLVDNELNWHFGIACFFGLKKIGDDGGQFIDQAFQRLSLGVKAEEIALLDEPDSGFGVMRGFDDDAAGHRTFNLEYDRT